MKNVSAYSNVKNISTIGNTQTGHHYWVGKVGKEKDFFAGTTVIPAVRASAQIGTICIHYLEDFG